MTSTRVVPPHPTDENSQHDDRYPTQATVDADLALKASAIDVLALTLSNTLRDATISALGAEVTIATAETFDPATYGATRSLTDPGSTIRTANLAALQEAADDALAAGGMLVIKGDYWISGTLTIRCHTDARSGVIHQTDAATAMATLVVGSLASNARTLDRYMMLPAIRQEGKTGTGWSGNDIGIQLSNLYHCHVTIPEVQDFSRNMVFSALGCGNVYNHYFLGDSENGKIGAELLPLAGAWVNENIFYQGRFHIDSGEGTNISGARHILISSNSANGVNNNRFFKPSIEGDGPEYHVDMTDALYNIFDQARYESSPPKVRLTDCNSNAFWYGYNAHAVQYTITNSPNTHIKSRQGETLFAGGETLGNLRLSNRSSNAYPAIGIWPTDVAQGSASTTNFAWFWTATDLMGKLHGDAHPRIRIEADTGRVYIGDGTADPIAFLRANAATTTLITSGNVRVQGSIRPVALTNGTAEIYAGSGSPEGVQAAGVGSLYLRNDGGAGTSLYIKETGAGTTGWVAK